MVAAEVVTAAETAAVIIIISRTSWFFPHADSRPYGHNIFELLEPRDPKRMRQVILMVKKKLTMIASDNLLGQFLISVPFLMLQAVEFSSD